MTDSVGRRWSLVLAGGDGTRLQELTRQITGAPIPKQYCRLLGEQSLLEATLERARAFSGSAHTLVVVNRNHLRLAREQVSSVKVENVLVQPRNRDTGPGVLYALLALQQRDPDARVALFPSDHFIRDEAAFSHCIDTAGDFVDRASDKIVLLGIRPDVADTGYGYISPGARLLDTGRHRFFDVAGFVEKPSPAHSLRLLEQGAMWNAFVMVARVSHVVGLLERLVPAAVAALRPAVGDPVAAERTYLGLQAWNFSHQFLAKVTPHLVVLAAEGTGWSDWGTPESIERTLRQLNQDPPWQRPVTEVALAQ